MTTPSLSRLTGLLAPISRIFRLPVARLSTRIAIDAPPETVWPLIADPAGHLRWNPNLRRMEGRLEEGARFVMALGAPGARPMTFSPRVLERREGRALVWLGRLWLPGIFDGRHSLRVEPDGRGGSVFVNEEDFRGILLWVMDVARFRPDFEVANAGLKRVAEGQTP